MEHINPYEASQTVATPQHVVGSSYGAVVVTPVAMAALLGTKVWVQIVGYLMFVVVAIQLVTLVAGGSHVGGGFFMALVAPILFLVVYVVLALRLLQYGKAIKKLASSQHPADFERAMEVSSKYWRLTGMMFALLIGLSILLVLFAILFV